MSNAIVQYTASDGCEVKLTPAIVAKYIVSGTTQPNERELYAFMAKCQARGLNPLAGDAYMVCYGGKSQVVTSKDYFVRAAANAPTFDGMEAGIIVGVQDGSIVYREGAFLMEGEDLLGGWARVYDKRRAHPSFEAVSVSEYDTGKSLWASKPATMIRKVAMCHAIREAYPEMFGGVYDSSELGEPAPKETEAVYEAADDKEEEF